MKRIFLVLLLSASFATAISAQTTGTRPRRVENGQTTTTQAPKRQTLPPFLGGAAESSQSPQTAPTPLPQSSTRSSTPSAPQSAPVLQSKTAPRQDPTPLPNQSPSASAQTVKTSAGDGETIEEDDDVIRVETSIVTVPVTVVDRDGRFIPGLRKEDFAIYEDGKQQEIANFATTEQPFTVVLLLDVSNSTRFKINEIQDAAIAFVRQLKENDRVMVIAFSEDVQVLSEPTSDRYRLASAIRRAQFGSGTSLYDAVDYVLNQRLSEIEGRKAVVLFTDGVDTTSKLADYNGNVRDAEETEALFYPVYYNTYVEMQDRNGGSRGGRVPFPRRRGGWGDIIGVIIGGGTVGIGGGGGSGGGAGTSRADYERGERYLEDLAAKSGGRFYQADSTRNLETAFYGIAEELRRQYSLGYYPTETGQTGQRKQIKVRSNRPGAVVRSRDSYIVGEGQGKNKFVADN